MLSVIKASAGSGKTFQLARHYILYLLGDKKDEAGVWSLAPNVGAGRHRHILAITFTNAATEEMKTRILSELALLAGLETGSSDHLDYLCDTLHTSAEAVSEAAGRALRALLWDYGHFHVSTIDSFFQTVLRTFAHEAELSGDYAVDLDKDPAVYEGVDRVMQDVKEADPGAEVSERARHLRKWVTEFMLYNLRNQQSAQIFDRSGSQFRQLAKFFSEVTDETYADLEADLDNYLARPELIDEFTRKLKAEREALPARLEAVLEDRGPRVLEIIDTLNGNKIKVLRPWLQMEASELVRQPRNGPVGKMAAKPRKAFKDATEAALRRAGRDPEEVAADIQAVCAAIDGAQVREKLLAKVSANIYRLGLILEVKSRIRDYRSEVSTILLNDTNNILRHIIGGHDTPFVYERMGLELKHLLIDEFQDTSRLQWGNLKPLVLNSLATGLDNLIIGDVKQSIYGFRNSDYSILAGLDADRDFHGSVRVDASRSTNYRSARSVVEFNNEFFAALRYVYGIDAGPEATPLPEMEANYADAEQNIRHNDMEGYVSLRNVPKDDQVEATIDNIRQQLIDGYKPGDIAVLVRTHVQASNFITALLERAHDEGADSPLAGVKVISDDAMLISNSRAVQIIISVLRYLGGTDITIDERSTSKRRLARILHSIAYHLAVDPEADPDAPSPLTRAVRAARLAEDRNAEAGADNTDAADAAADPAMPDDLQAIAARIDCFTLPAIVERIAVEVVPPALRESELVYINALHDEAQAFATGIDSRNGLVGFLKWWDERGVYKAKVGVNLATDAVRVLTIHTAKGLEFKCVNVFGLGSRNSKDASKDVWVDSSRAFSRADYGDCVPPSLPIPLSALKDTGAYDDDYRAHCLRSQIECFNVLYVALTRAVERLYISAEIRSSKNNSKFDPLCSSYSEMFHRSLEAMGCTPEEGCERGEAGPRPAREETAKKASRLQAVAAPREIPAYTRVERENLWRHTVIKREQVVQPDSPLARLRDMMLHVETPADVESLGRCQATPSEAAALRARVAERPGWFSPRVRALTRHTVLSGNGHTATCDRIIFNPDGSVDVVNYALPPEYLPDDKQVDRITERASIVRRSLPRGTAVRAHLWNLLTGAIVSPPVR